MRAGARWAGVQAPRVVVDHVVVVSSRRFPRWATADRETTRWFAERYNTVTTQSTVPNKSGVWRGRCCCCCCCCFCCCCFCCCCCIVEVVLWRRGGGGDDDAIAYERAHPLQAGPRATPLPQRTQAHVHYTNARTHAGRHARAQAGAHTHKHARICTISV